MQTHIRKAKQSDLPALLEVQLLAYHVHTSWLSVEQIPPLNETMHMLETDFLNKTIFVAHSGDHLLGSIRYVFKSGVCMLERLSVHPQYQNQGMGRVLILEVEQNAMGNAHKISLETGLLASDLIRFYTKLGYAEEAVLRNNYGRFDWVGLSKFSESKAK